ncbi:MgtC/SapB family protein [Candidatus Amarolinea aalborgensis]|jgi:putative Mg2+ transporter-C (MgtC) family protein|uniref:MgtC/SapB family protein n=1 Tax=Candidatus Amarolinea aalborgensis TaxID=2249329 RepID=UPI003BFA07F7
MNPHLGFAAQFSSLGPVAFKVTLAALLGSLIGLERIWNRHPAGLRTNMVISLASCLFTILSVDGFPMEGTTRDTARVAAQIVTGVGFLGAGALLQTKSSIRGLTTAATIWLVAAVGMAVGVGAFALAIFTTVLTIVSLVALAPVSFHLEERAKERQRLRLLNRKNGKLPAGSPWAWHEEDEEDDELGEADRHP